MLFDSETDAFGGLNARCMADFTINSVVEHFRFSFERLGISMQEFISYTTSFCRELKHFLKTFGYL